MPALRLRSGRMNVQVEENGLCHVGVTDWPGFRLGPLEGVVRYEAPESGLIRRSVGAGTVGPELRDEYAPGLVLLRRVLQPEAEDVVIVEAELSNASGRAVEVLDVDLLRCSGGVSFGRTSEAIRIYQQGAYWSRVSGPRTQPEAGGAAGEEDASQRPQVYSSENVWLAYDAASGRTFLAGFETGERWTGHIRAVAEPGRMPSEWAAGFNAGRTILQPGETWRLETLCLMAGPDPWRLLCAYGDRVARRHGVHVNGTPPVTWCSWYPYRLGVSTERVLANAMVAKQRLQSLGLRHMLVDLGWQRSYLPSAFEENDQFPGGLGELAARLEEQGFLLGAWCAPFTISEHDALVREHPDWLLSTQVGEGDRRVPSPRGTWFWEPHGETFALDLTHPEARVWLRDRIRSLARRGVRYLKTDFLGTALAGDLTGRHDPRVVAGGGAEAARMGMEIMSKEIVGGHPEAMLLNCGGPEIPGKGRFPLLYTCADTGNTGYVGWNHLKQDYGVHLAGHLWKNRRWGILQPSCLVVGLPGDVEEVRARATATFLSGGQVDIGDDLTRLPEERWRVLLSVLPPTGQTAEPVDLFVPVDSASLDYDALASGRGGADVARPGEIASRVWVLQVRGSWDQWTLIGLFNYDTNDNAEYGKAAITRFRLPLQRLGLTPGSSYTVMEFWSGMSLGTLPRPSASPAGYRHPGDAAALLEQPDPAHWEASFFGPCVKVLIVRSSRDHPWPLGTTFHLSGGLELEEIAWRANRLQGVLRRPSGQTGEVVVDGRGCSVREARVEGRRAPWRTGANGSVILPIVTGSDRTRWEICFSP